MSGRRWKARARRLTPVLSNDAEGMAALVADEVADGGYRYGGVQSDLYWRRAS